MKSLLFHLNVLLLFSTALPAFCEPDKSNRITPTVIAVAKVMPSVVNLSTEKIVTKTYSPWGELEPSNGYGELFSKSVQEKTHSLGSASIIDPSGLIVTNFHVVHRATRIDVTLSDGRKFHAREIASADLNDIALLKIDGLPENELLKPIEMAKIGDLYLGETVLAVGNPYGLGNSISQGLLSAIGRKAVHNGVVVLSNILQTDAAINPGNSGGPLVNLDAQMIGVTIAIHKDAQGIGFAVPLERVVNLLAQWLIPERSGNYSLGFVPGAKRLYNGNIVLYVADVLKDSPSWQAQLPKNAEISTINGNPPGRLIDLSRQLWRMKAGDSLTITIKTGESYHLVVEEIPQSDGKAIARIRLGLGLQELTGPIAAALGYPFDQGVIISEILPGRDQVLRGDVLARLGDVPIYSLTDIGKALRNKSYGDKIKATVISVKNKGKEHYLLKKIVFLDVL